MIEFLTGTWPWWFSGIFISATMFALLYFGQSFGFSSNLRTICSAAGMGKMSPFFNFNWKSQIWNLVFLVGALVGGFIANQFLSSNSVFEVSTKTVADLKELGFASPRAIQPNELFSWEAISSVKGFLLLAMGGLLVGFGSRYAGGCTSGHAISGLSDLQFPSLIAVIGFFLGGLTMVHIIFPLLF